MTLKWNKARVITHLALALLSLEGCGVTYLLTPQSSLTEILTLGTGYIGLILLAVSLLIGPFNFLRKRSNPVNINFRRDVGIWAGIDSLLHVLFSFMLAQGGDFLTYFLGKGADGYSLPTFDTFTIANYGGLIATIILLVLLVTSNQLSLRWLKGKRWKLIQRFNYPLVALVVVHTVIYQMLNLREGIFAYSVLLLSVITVAAQMGGVIVYRRRAQRRKADFAPVPVQVVVPALTKRLLARRQFLTICGAAVVGGFTGGILADRVLFASPPNVTKPTGTAVAQAPQPTQSATITTVNVPTQTVANQPTTAIAAPTQTSTSVPVSRTAASTATALPTASSTARSIVLSSAASLAPGTALKFTTPDTKESAFVVRLNDGSVKAYSSICTHRPYDLVFDSKQQALVCDLHNVPFNVSNGAPTRRPASRALKSFAVQIDPQGNILYIQS